MPDNIAAPVHEVIEQTPDPDRRADYTRDYGLGVEPDVAQADHDEHLADPVSAPVDPTVPSEPDAASAPADPAAPAVEPGLLGDEGSSGAA